MLLTRNSITSSRLNVHLSIGIWQWFALVLPFDTIFIFTSRNVTLTSMTVCLPFGNWRLILTSNCSTWVEQRQSHTFWRNVCFALTSLWYDTYAFKVRRLEYTRLLFAEVARMKERNRCSMFSLHFFWSAECEMLFTWRTSSLCIKYYSQYETIRSRGRQARH